MDQFQRAVQPPAGLVDLVENLERGDRVDPAVLQRAEVDHRAVGLDDLGDGVRDLVTHDQARAPLLLLGVGLAVVAGQPQLGLAGLVEALDDVGEDVGLARLQRARHPVLTVDHPVFAVADGDEDRAGLDDVVVEADLVHEVVTQVTLVVGVDPQDRQLDQLRVAGVPEVEVLVALARHRGSPPCDGGGRCPSGCAPRPRSGRSRR